MNGVQWFYYLPLWVLYAGTILIVFCAFEGGFRLGRFHKRSSEGIVASPVGSMVAATLGLLAFMLSFTFATASSHFDARKQVLFEEANTIRTVYGLADLFPEPTGERMRALLREYVDVRLQKVRTPEELRSFIDHSEKIHEQLWFEVMEFMSKNPGRIDFFVVESLSEMINLHSKRISVALRWNIPITIWLLLYVMTVLGISSMGYHAGLFGTRGSFSCLVLGLAFSIVMVLIADLDRPRQDLFRVNQKSLIELRQSMDEKAH
jgi:hypothetical protein